METIKEKKTALITGASGGIGKAFAEILAADGYDLVLVARSADELNRIAGMEMAKNQTRVIPVPLDLSKTDAVEKLVAELTERDIQPDLIINNAGVGLVGETARLSTDRQLAMIDLNIRALTEITLQFLSGMKDRNAGGIINVSSVAAFLPGPYMSIYYATKAYVQSFTSSLADELKGSEVRVMSLCPGPVDTGFQSAAGLDTSRWIYKLMQPKSAHDVAEAGWAGFKAGNKRVFPGLFDMLTAWTAKLLPRSLLTPVIRIFQKPKQS